MIKQNHTTFIAQTLSFADVENAESQDHKLSYLKFVGRKKDVPMAEKKLRKAPFSINERMVKNKLGSRSLTYSPF